MRLAPFIDQVRGRAGESLRAIQWYRNDQVELVYIREDLELDEIQRRAQEIHRNLMEDRDSANQAEVEHLGEELASVKLRERAVLIHLPIDETSGVVMGLEPDVARSLHSFVTDCRDTLIELRDHP